MTNHMPNVRDLLSSLRKAGWYITAFELHYNKHDYVVVFEDAAHLNKNKQYFSASLTFYDIHDPNRVLSDVYANTSKLDIPLSTFYNFFDIDASNRSYNSGDVIFSFYSTLNSKMPGTFNLAAQNAHQKEILSTIERREPSDGMCCYSARHNPGTKKRSVFNTAKTKLLRPSLYEKIGEIDPKISFCYRKNNELNDTEIIRKLKNEHSV